MIMRAIRATMLVALSPALCAQAKVRTEYVVGLPSKIDEPIRKVLAKSVIDLVYGGAPGDRYVFVNAQDIQRIRAFERRAVRSKRALLKRMRGELGAIGKYLKEAVSEDGSAASATIRLPQFLAMAGSLRDPARKTRVVVFGSPFYRDDASFAMGDGLYPSDAHLWAPRQASVYSCMGKETLLRDAGVYFGYLTESLFKDSFERDAIRRWWQVYCASHSAVLGQISASAPDVVEAAVRGDMRPAVNATVDKRDQRLEMRRAGAQVPVQPRSKLSKAADAIEAPKRGTFTVAGFWPVANGSRVDVDVYLQARPGAEEISFRKTETADGRLLRDVRGGGRRADGEKWRASWEVIEVNETLLRGSKAWLNLYSYEGPGPIEGIVRVALGARHVDLPFVFAAGVQGNGILLGQDKRAKSPHWVPIDLAAAFKRLGAQR